MVLENFQKVLKNGNSFSRHEKILEKFSKDPGKVIEFCPFVIIMSLVYPNGTLNAKHGVEIQ